MCCFSPSAFTFCLDFCQIDNMKTRWPSNDLITVFIVSRHIKPSHWKRTRFHFHMIVNVLFIFRVLQTCRILRGISCIYSLAFLHTRIFFEDKFHQKWTKLESTADQMLLGHTRVLFGLFTYKTNCFRLRLSLLLIMNCFSMWKQENTVPC